MDVEEIEFVKMIVFMYNGYDKDRYIIRFIDIDKMLLFFLFFLGFGEVVVVESLDFEKII